MKKVIIIDDERLARVELKQLLRSFPDLEIVAEAANVEKGVQVIKQYQPDLIFLDIEMPEQSGFDLLEEIETQAQVIFTTAYSEYAIKAFEFNALDYLLKPIQEERLSKAIERVLAAPSKTEETTNIEPFKNHIYLKDGEQNHFIALTDIALFSSYGNYAKVHFDHQSILIHSSLNQLEQRLPRDLFFRANRYSILNVQHIKSLKQLPRGKLKMLLYNELEIEVSERKSVLFRELWGI
ncbi:MAG: LytTR family DNA-binding domain-containing protein [Bacteroidota bacterium]